MTDLQPVKRKRGRPPKLKHGSASSTSNEPDLTDLHYLSTCTQGPSSQSSQATGIRPTKSLYTQKPPTTFPRNETTTVPTMNRPKIAPSESTKNVNSTLSSTQSTQKSQKLNHKKPRLSIELCGPVVHRNNQKKTSPDRNSIDQSPSTPQSLAHISNILESPSCSNKGTSTTMDTRGIGRFSGNVRQVIDETSIILTNLTLFETPFPNAVESIAFFQRAWRIGQQKLGILIRTEANSNEISQIRSFHDRAKSSLVAVGKLSIKRLYSLDPLSAADTEREVRYLLDSDRFNCAPQEIENAAFRFGNRRSDFLDGLNATFICLICTVLCHHLRCYSTGIYKEPRRFSQLHSGPLFQRQLETWRDVFADNKHERLLLNRIRRQIIRRCEETSLARPVVPEPSAALLDAKQDAWLKELEDEAAEEQSGDGFFTSNATTPNVSSVVDGPRRGRRAIQGDVRLLSKSTMLRGRLHAPAAGREVGICRREATKCRDVLEKNTAQMNVDDGGGGSSESELSSEGEMEVYLVEKEGGGDIDEETEEDDEEMSSEAEDAYKERTRISIDEDLENKIAGEEEGGEEEGEEEEGGEEEGGEEDDDSE
ncbi:hypothetical protein RUND412_004460 [Rhizina undulata]